MALKHAYYLPYSKYLDPSTATDGDEKRLENTIQSLRDIAHEIALAKPDVIMMISPDNVEMPNRFNVLVQQNISAMVNGREINIETQPELAESIQQKSYDLNIPIALTPTGELNPGFTIPLDYLVDDLPKHTKVIPVSTCHLDRQQHVEFGQYLSNQLEERPENIILISTGTLASRLSDEGGKQAHILAPQFDQQVQEAIKIGRPDAIWNMPENIVSAADSNGYNSLLVLLGLISQHDYDAGVRTYEAAHGIGFITAAWKIS